MGPQIFLTIFFVSLLLLVLHFWPSKDISNHRKIGDKNEALQICKLSTQTASVRLNELRKNLKNNKMILCEIYVEMAETKLKYFNQN